MTNKISIFVICHLSFVIILSASDYRITSASGSVAVLPKGATRASPASVNFPIEEGDRVITGPNAKVELATKEGSVIELDQNSELEIESLSDKVEKFFLKAGGFLSRLKSELKKKTRPRYQIKTPVAVASVRGTDLALVIDEDGSLQAGVLEGEVLVETEAEDIVLNEEQRGAVIEKGKPIVRTLDVPPLVVRRKIWFQHVRDRVPKIQREWNRVDEKHLRRIRERSLKERIQWERPKRVKPKKFKPRRRRPR